MRCDVMLDVKRVAHILTEATQQKHGPPLSVYDLMGVTGYLRPILRSPLVFPTRCNSFTTAGPRTRIASDISSCCCAAFSPPPLPLTFLLFGLSDSLSEKHTHTDTHTHTHTGEALYQAFAQPDSKRTLEHILSLKVLISHNRLLCGSRGGRPVVLSEQPSVGVGGGGAVVLLT